MNIPRGYSVRLGRTVRIAFLIAAIMPWPFAVVSLIFQRWALGLMLLVCGFLGWCHYAGMKHFTRTMDRFVMRHKPK